MDKTVIQAIAFDLDGTLHDQESGERAALERLYRQDIRLDPSASYADFLRVWRNTADEFLEQYHRGRMTFEEQRVRRMIAVYENFGRPLSPDEARVLNDLYVAYYEQEWRPFPDVYPALDALAPHFRLGIITNGDGERQRGKLKACGLERYFGSVVISGEVGSAKPDKAIFEKSRLYFGLEPAQMAYVGDRVDIDVLGAQGAGWRAIFLDRKGMPGTPGVETLQSLSELEALLKT